MIFLEFIATATSKRILINAALIESVMEGSDKSTVIVYQGDRDCFTEVDGDYNKVYEKIRKAISA